MESPTKTKPESAPKWYKHGGVFFGNLMVHYTASLIYAAFAIAPIFGIATDIIQFKDLKSPFVLVWALLVVLAHPVWSWLETRSFESWVRMRDQETRKIERHYYGLMLNHAKTFWTAMLAVYSFAGIWSLLTEP